MKQYIYFLILALLFCGQAMAQTGNGTDRLLPTGTSSAGNYIYLLNAKELIGADSGIVKKIDHFIIEKAVYSNKDADKTKMIFKTVGIARTVANENDLKNVFSASNIEEFKKYFALKSNKELVNYFHTHQSASSYALFYKVIETRLALGHVFLDKDVVKDQLVAYKVTRVDKDKSETPWGYALVQSKVGNYALSYFKPVISKIFKADSSVAITWKFRIKSNIEDIPKPKTLFPGDLNGSLFRMPFDYKDLNARLHIANDTGFVGGTGIFGALNAKADTLSFTYFKKTKHEEHLKAYITLEDELYNEGAPSDTVNFYAVPDKRLPIIASIHVKDIVDAVQVSWKPLPVKPYLIGIDISRYDSEDKLEHVASLNAKDTIFLDYTIQPGQHYRYQVKALFLPGTGLEQKTPAQGVGTYTLFSKPVAPYSLEAGTEGANIRLRWESEYKASLFGYYVFRGTSPQHMSMVAGPVKTKTFLDSAKSLSGRSQYYYAVYAKNLRQDTSAYSNTVSIRPARNMDIQPPAEIQFYYANNKLDVRWKDVRAKDNVVESFVLQKRKKGEVDFATLKLSPKAVFYTDTLLQAGITYQYRVASVADNAQVSMFSDAFEFTLPKKPVETLNLFYVRSVTGAVVVSLPEMVYPNRKAYNIYRRKATGGAFEKAGSINANSFSFTDDKIEPATVYIYTVSITETDDREGAFGSSLSVRSNGGSK